MRCVFGCCKTFSFSSCLFDLVAECGIFFKDASSNSLGDTVAQGQRPTPSLTPGDGSHPTPIRVTQHRLEVVLCTQVHTQVGAAHTVDTASSIMTSPQVEVACLEENVPFSKSKTTMQTDGALGGSLSSSTSDGGRRSFPRRMQARDQGTGEPSLWQGSAGFSRNPEKARMGQWEVGPRGKKQRRKWG